MKMHPMIKNLTRRALGRSSLIIHIALIVIIAPLLLYHLLAYGLQNSPQLVPEAFRSARNILIVTAHPDDETLFFSPSVLYREGEEGVKRSLLVLSSGNYNGIGDSRQIELQRSCAQLGIEKDRCTCLDLYDLQDDPKAWWDEDVVGDLVGGYVLRWRVDLIITFDEGGISGHVNHRAVNAGIRKYICQNPHSAPPAYALQTKSILRKYSSLIDLIPTSVPFSWRILSALLSRTEDSTATITTTVEEDPYADKALLVSGWRRYFQARGAFAQHWSQYSWDRGLYLILSRYMWVNDLRRIV